MNQRVRLWSLRLATAIAVPTALLLAGEAGLRTVGYGHSGNFTVPCVIQGRRSYCENDRFSWQFFPAGLFRLPYSFAMPAKKAPGTFRIFAIQLQPTFAVDAYNQIGVIQLHQGRFAPAAATFQRAIELDTARARAAELQYNLRYARTELAKATAAGN